MVTIQLFIRDGQIMSAGMRDGSPDQSLIDLFGTHILPTPYMAAFGLERAVKTIQARNPAAKVMIS